MLSNLGVVCLWPVAVCTGRCMGSLSLDGWTDGCDGLLGKVHLGDEKEGLADVLSAVTFICKLLKCTDEQHRL